MVARVAVVAGEHRCRVRGRVRTVGADGQPPENEKIKLPLAHEIRARAMARALRPRLAPAPQVQPLRCNAPAPVVDDGADALQGVFRANFLESNLMVHLPAELSLLAAQAQEALCRSLVPLECEKGVVANEMDAQLALALTSLIALDVPPLAEDSGAIEWGPLAFKAWGHSA